MTARESAAAVSRALYGDDGAGFVADEARYVSGFGLRHSTPAAFVLAHLVSVAWPMEHMITESSPDGDCWFIYLAAGNIPEITAALAAVKVTKWLAFERGNHPHLVETHRFLNGQQTQKRTRYRATGAESGRTAPDERFPDAVHEAAAVGPGGATAGAVPSAASDSNSFAGRG